MPRIPVAGPWITEKEIATVTEAVTNAWYEHANDYHSRFESKMAEVIGRKYTMALPSCTSAIHLALAAIGIGPGDEVIVPDITWIASAAPIVYLGAKPVFADVDPDTWCLDVESFAWAITPRTRAVIPVDLYGGLPDIEAIKDIAEDTGIAVVEDAAEALGSTYKGKMAGAFGRASVFSFHGSKTVTTGEGGMLLTDDEALFNRALFLRDHGRSPGDVSYRNDEVAFKYKMSAMQAALGLAQIERLDELIKRKREIFSWYQEQLGDINSIVLNAEPEGVSNSYWFVTAILSADLATSRDTLMRELSEDGIDTRPFFHPLSSLPAFSGYPGDWESRNPVAYDLALRGINLPSGYNMTKEKVAQVCKALQRKLF